MTTAEQLLLLVQAQSLALNRATKELTNALVQIESAKAHIIRLAGENEVLRLNLEEARVGRSVRQ